MCQHQSHSPMSLKAWEQDRDVNLLIMYNRDKRAGMSLWLLGRTYSKGDSLRGPIRPANFLITHDVELQLCLLVAAAYSHDRIHHVEQGPPFVP